MKPNCTGRPCALLVVASLSLALASLEGCQTDTAGSFADGSADPIHAAQGSFLPVDDTVLATPADCGGAQAQITPTETSCEDFASGNAATLWEMTYTTKGSDMVSVAPGVFFYYTELTGSAGDAISISQTHTETPPGDVQILNGQAILYSSTCWKLGSLDVTGGTATGTLPSSGTFIIGVKYAPSSLKGEPAPSPTSTYTFDTEVNGAEEVNASIDLDER